MRVEYSYASDYSCGDDKITEWNSLEDMLAFMEEHKRELIVGRNEDGLSVTIYDDYVE